MANYERYHQWLFPGDPILEPNPGEVAPVDPSSTEALSTTSYWVSPYGEIYPVPPYGHVSVAQSLVDQGRVTDMKEHHSPDVYAAVEGWLQVSTEQGRAPTFYFETEPTQPQIDAVFDLARAHKGSRLHRDSDIFTFEAMRWIGRPSITRNPAEADATADQILEEVSCQTGVKVEWLKRSVREVLDGMAGLGCLWFLHGAKGTVVEKTPIPRRIDIHLEELQRAVSDETQRKGEERGQNVRSYTEVDWQRGTVLEETWIVGKTAPPKKRMTRLGKWVKKHRKHLDPETVDKIMQAFQTRNPGNWNFEVSCSPYDVLTMSHGRPWAGFSCMRPGGMFEYGPLTDMVAGAAIVWFLRPGSDQPAGRLILRPYHEARNTPGIATGGRLYGSGPSIKPRDLNEMLGPFLEGIEIERIDICPLGKDSQALTRAIYSDTDRLAGGCQQTVEEYGVAYQVLGELPWPSPKFELGAIAEAAKRQTFEGYEYRGMDDGGLTDEEEARHREAAEALLAYGTDNITNWLEMWNMEGISLFWGVTDESMVREQVTEFIDNAIDLDTSGQLANLQDIPGEILDDLYDVLWHDYAEQLRKTTLEEDYWMVTMTKDQVNELRMNDYAHDALRTVYFAIPQHFVPRFDIKPENLKWYLEEYYSMYEKNGLYYDIDSDELIHSVVFFPQFYHDANDVLKEYLSNETALWIDDEFDTDDVKAVEPNPLLWLDHLTLADFF